MFPTNSERLIGISDAFSAFVYGYPSSCPRAQCTPNKSVTTLALHPHYYIIQAMPVGTYRVQSPGFPKIVYSHLVTVHYLFFYFGNWPRDEILLLLLLLPLLFVNSRPCKSGIGTDWNHLHALLTTLWSTTTPSRNGHGDCRYFIIIVTNAIISGL